LPHALGERRQLQIKNAQKSTCEKGLFCPSEEDLKIQMFSEID